MSPLQQVVILVSILGTLVAPAFCGGDSDLSNIASCLIDNGVKNFTLYPKNDDPAASTSYFKLLDFSIQNLRFAAASSEPKPVAIIMPESKEELAKSVVCCRKGSWEIRVRCGGHSYEGISSVANDGSRFVIIDMMNLDGVSVDLETQTAWVESGATLGQTYYAISRKSDSHGFSAGSCPTVGVGGHISGGGFGLLSRKYGVAADNVVDAILVDAEGRVLDRKSMGEEVFWAIRGGGGGVWGIIYAWKIKLLQVPKIVTGFIVSRAGTKQYLSKLVHKWQHVAPNLDENFYLSATLGAGLQTSIELSISFKGFYLGRTSDAISILNNVFPELSVREEDYKEMSWIDSIFFFSGLSDDYSISHLTDRYLEDKSFFKAKSDYVKTPIPVTGIKTALHILEKQPKGLVILDPYGGAMQNISEESIAFPHRKGNLFGIQYLVYWNESDDDKSEDFMEWIRGFYSAMAPHVSRSPRAAYINYMDLDLGTMDDLGTLTAPEDAVKKARLWGEKYFLNNYDRLVRAKTIIDPHNVFRHQQGIPPIANATAKLSQAYYWSSLLSQ